MNRLVSIALYTFREAVRNKILYSILFFAICMILLSTVLGAASMRQDERVLKNISLFGIALFSDIIAIFLGVTMVYQELERKTVYNLLSKPIARWVYFLGKYAGMSLVLLVQLALMSLTLVGVMLVRGDAITSSLASAFWLIGVESLLVGAFALFFSSFSTPYVSGFLALGLWLVGRMLQELESYLPSIESAFPRSFLGALTQIFPDLSLFGLTTQLSAAVAIPWMYVWNTTVYGFGYIALFLLAGVYIFRRRDFI